MKAAIYPGAGKPIQIDTLPDPEPGPDDVIIKVSRCGICGTDLTMTKGSMWDFGTNVQFGHEYAGEIVALGKNVSQFRLGENIAVCPSVSCGTCHACSTHKNNVLCTAMADGAMKGFAELARVPVSVATRLPQVLSLADGALIEPLAVSLYGARLANIKPGERVLVLGGGTVALYAIYWARRLGAGKIVAMSRSLRRKDLCLEMGADAFVPFGDNEVSDVAEALGGSAEVVLEGVGAEGMLTKAVMHAAQFARIVSMGFCVSPDALIPAMASYKCVSMQFAVGYRMEEFHYIADQLDRGHCDVKAVITSNVPLLDLPKTMELLRGPNEETKVHVCM